MKQKKTLRHRKPTVCTRGREERGRDRLGGWDQQIPTAVYRVNNKLLPY